MTEFAAHIPPSSPTADRVNLGQTGIQVSPLGLGTWAWGDTTTWNYGKQFGEAELRLAYDATRAAGINFLDTAEIYGSGRSERFVGQFVAATRDEVVIATKFMPWPWRVRGASLLGALRASLRRLDMEQVDLYQVHWPIPLRPVEIWMDAMAEAVRAGLTRTIGVSNFNASQTRRAVERLARHNITLAANQVEYSLLQRAPERNGVMQALRDAGSSLIAYSPLAMGMLTGKYTPENPPPGLRGRRYPPASLARIGPLVALVHQIGEAHAKTPSQVALNWVICKGAIPIPGAKNARQAEENAGALGWRLDAQEMAALDAASDRVQKR